MADAGAARAGSPQTGQSEAEHVHVEVHEGGEGKEGGGKEAGPSDDGGDGAGVDAAVAPKEGASGASGDGSEGKDASGGASGATGAAAAAGGLEADGKASEGGGDGGAGGASGAGEEEAKADGFGRRGDDFDDDGGEPSPHEPEERVVIITGAGVGTGAALASRLARLGKRVLALDSSDELLADVARIASAWPVGELVPLAVDLASADGRAKVVDFVKDNALCVEALVLNHAVLGPLMRTNLVSPEDWATTMAINVEAPLFLTNALLPLMSRTGRIINVSSGLARRELPGAAAYCASKHALHAALACLKEELDSEPGRHPVIGSARPGPLDTAMQDVIDAVGAGAEMSKGFAALIEIKRATTHQNLRTAVATAAAEDRMAAALMQTPPRASPVSPANKSLEDPETSARFLSWVVLGCAPYLFARGELDPREEETANKWRDWEGRVDDALEAMEEELRSGGPAVLDPLRSPLRTSPAHFGANESKAENLDAVQEAADEDADDDDGGEAKEVDAAEATADAESESAKASPAPADPVKESEAAKLLPEDGAAAAAVADA
uniref:Uncharacterized protein n=1 Tax=Bicosoecida sp. CB-2014 TaxID=1486930 RepID=A0A7S1C8G9_9STRA|mmetsp:Transcript_15337/g.53277  ORF Transcript_15337/g.53277 Transcript_15337/m.53277 type:complete len:556 (+) Transcript_15337:11-1678(+)